jgi:glycosyltransferase involved in cell wall biosynthesis
MSVKISVFITSYNQKAYLIEAIESVLNQTLKPFEIIIVDDCSTDGSQQVIERYAQANPELIRPFYHEQNLGIAKNKAFAQRQVRGDWLTYLDGDDRFLPQKLELEWETLLKHPEAKVVYSNFYLIDAEGKKLHLWTDGVEAPSGYIFPQTFARTFTPYYSDFRNELIAYECLKEAGFYDKERVTHEDWDLKIRLTKRFLVAYCNVPLIEYRRHDKCISRTSSDAFRFRQMQQVYYKNRPLLDDVGLEERSLIKSELYKFFSKRASKIIREELTKRQRLKAIQYYLEFLKWMSVKMAAKNLLYLLLPFRFKGFLKVFNS